MFDARTSKFVLTSVMYYDNLLNVKISLLIDDSTRWTGV